MALHENDLELAIKWVNVLVKNGASIKESCFQVSQWYDIDQESLSKAFMESCGSKM